MTLSVVRTTATGRSTMDSSGSVARSSPVAYRWNGLSRYVPVLPTMSMRSMPNSTPSAYLCLDSSRLRNGVISGPGRPGYVVMPASMT
jgi:hypothetical protein